MMSTTKIVTVVFSLFGVSELGSQATFGKSPAWEFSKHVAKHIMSHMNNLVENMESDEHYDDRSHQRAWGEDHLSHSKFHEKMKQKTEDFKHCHMGCGMDRECHMKCPKPWQKFQDKCEKMKPFFACHKDCSATHGNNDCHKKCPLPEHDRRMNSLAMKAKACHMKCEGILDCHAKGKCHMKCEDRNPLSQVYHKCKALEEITACHRECGMDYKCLILCVESEIEKLWHMTQHRHHAAQFLKNHTFGSDGVFATDF